ncbi:PREDICTED: uncharacterized protein LOC105971242 [Erythranthe guttata]|uniref:uncharacterized protein LOC105971242 n=1 Tax=Erythranthe guttata TaxID=4155 RepID=UPI00064DAB4A|nr:PREDICTED: uncharacterized protein LOC105971242 [Erythranthe guttata]|eukprot:XP_012851547.1 PREDICTED: uncharacterized protein LOC105971242 [Erythranthe guttata]
MNCVFWNCQGLGAPLTIHVLGDILRVHRPRIVFLSETRATLLRIERLKKQWNLNGVGVEKVGQSGGLVLFWQKDLAVDLISYSNNHIDAEVFDENQNSKWRVTGFYGFPEQGRRKLLGSVALDRVCASSEWISKFPHARVHHLNYSGSDHVPIKLVLRVPTRARISGKKRPFRFEATWLRRENCEQIIENQWRKSVDAGSMESVIYKNSECRLALILWSKLTVQQPRKKIKSLHKRLQSLLLAEQTVARREEIRGVRAELEQAYGDDDMYWRQRNRVQWIQEGDRNTRFFHSKATIRRRTNRVDRLKDTEGIWKEKDEDTENIISNYFEHIFKSTNPREDEIDEVLASVETRISREASQLLSKPFTSNEFGGVVPSRGLRQGDPLSPYLFICCAEALIAMIANATVRGEFQGVRVAQTTPMVSSLCFADDTLIFGHATEEYAVALKEILVKYARVSGQEINHQKSTMTFNQGWGEKQLSKAGKEVLIKAVLQAIPTYVMSCFLLPEGLIQEIEMTIRRFWWGNGENKGMVWLSWGEMCKAKELGGLGFRDLKAFNFALLVKQAWRIFTNPDLLLSKIIYARYFPNGYLFNANVGFRPSATWRSIWKVIPFLKMGLRRRIGNGLDTSIWGDPWLREGGGFKIFTKREVIWLFRIGSQI